METRIYLAQLLCPERHCVLAACGPCAEQWEADELAIRLKDQFDEMCELKMLNNECGLCHSTDLHVETGRTGFRTMEEAMPFLRELEEQQRRTAEAWKAARN